jgi:hypothetical protein
LKGIGLSSLFAGAIARHLKYGAAPRRRRAAVLRLVGSFQALRRMDLFKENSFASPYFDRRFAEIKNIVVQKIQVFRQIKTANRTREGFTTLDLFEVVISRIKSISDRTKSL